MAMSQTLKLSLIFTAILLLINAGFAAFYFFGLADDADAPAVAEKPVEESKPPPVLETGELGDDYYSIHFNYNDAVDACIMETRSRNKNIVQLSVNALSTRYNENDGFYLVKLDSHVGTPMLYDEKTHKCEVDPKIQGVAFYREIVKRRAIRPVP